MIFVDKARLLKRAIIISWCSLAFCFAIKIFGGNFFEIVCTNKNYIKFCNYAEKHLWLDFILSTGSTLLCQSLYLLAILQRYKFSKSQFVSIIVSCPICWVIRVYFNRISIICDLWLFSILPVIMLGKNYKAYLQVFIALLLNVTFQFVSLIVKNLAITRVDESIFVALIYGIDVDIMLFIYFLYRNFNKENKKYG